VSTAAQHPGPPLGPEDYPLSIHRPDLLRTPTGKPLSALTMDAVIAGEVDAEDVRIAPETLLLQAEVAESVHRRQLAANFRRAAELTAVPDAEVLEMYNALRPRASSKDRLLGIAENLDTKYGATTCAAFVREAAEVYERRDLLAREEDR
jgi:propanediol dehydratase small subunit